MVQPPLKPRPPSSTAVTRPGPADPQAAPFGGGDTVTGGGTWVPERATRGSRTWDSGAGRGDSRAGGRDSRARTANSRAGGGDSRVPNVGLRCWRGRLAGQELGPRASLPTATRTSQPAPDANPSAHLSPDPRIPRETYVSA